MSKLVRLEQDALDEIDAAVAWYEAQRPGLGTELIAAAEETKALLERL